MGRTFAFCRCFALPYIYAGAAVNVEVTPLGAALHEQGQPGFGMPPQQAWQSQGYPPNQGYQRPVQMGPPPGPQPAQPGGPQGYPLTMMAGPSSQGSSSPPSSANQGLGGLRDYDAVLPLDTGLELVSDDGVWFSSRPNRPRKDDENYDTSTLLSLPQKLYDMISEKLSAR
mmetsp:Transcript_37799/g.70528  ORF Transcript_37799/g.70528 Transcript_37799/m.70528 type:complete len:171 (+) Transcript_37799:43-555(+)